MYKRSKQKSWVRLLKQVNKSEIDFSEHGVKKIRWKSHHDTLIDGIFYDHHSRETQKSWKTHRKTQYKIFKAARMR